MKLKRILSLICVLTLLATCIAPIGITANTSTPVATISAGEATVEYKSIDAKVSIPIEIDSNVTLTALQMSVSFDSALSFTKYTKGDSLGFTKPTEGSNPVNLVFLDTMLEGVEATKGTLATLEFSVPTDAVKEFPLTVEITKAADATGANITSTIAAENGKISVEVEPIATISVGEAIAKTGTENAKVSVPVEIDSNVTLTALQMSVSFDSALSFTKYTKGDSLGFTKPTEGSNPVNLVFLDTMLEGVEAAKGTLATLEFSVPTDAVKEFPLTVEITKAADASGADITIMLATSSGKISVVDETVVGPTWPAKDSVDAITYGENLYKAFGANEKGEFADGVIGIDDKLDYVGKFVVVNSDTVPDAGVVEELKIKFVIADDPNYGTNANREFGCTEGYYSVTVNKKPLTVTVKDETIKYGDAIPNFTSTITGLVNGDEDAAIVLDYACAANDSSDIPDVGTYAITVDASNENYNITEVDGTLTIEQAKATDVDDVPAITGITAEDMKEIASTEAFITALKEDGKLLPTVELTYGDNKTATADVEWSSTDTWMPKGGTTYTITGTVTNSNLDVTEVTYNATVTVDAVNGTLDTSIIEDETIPKADATGSVFGIADIFPVEANLTYGETTEPVRLVWNMDDEEFVAALAAKAEGVSDGVDQEVTLTLDAAATLADYPWLTIDAGATAKVTITDKIPADVTLKIESDSIEYGSTVVVTSATCDTVGADAVIDITYKDSKNNVSTDAPTDAGTYTVIATLVNEVYSGSASKKFTITPKDIVVVVNDDADMIYGGDYKKVAELKEDYELEYGETVEDLKLTYKVIDELGEAVDHTKAVVGGVYKITATDDNPNYNVSVVDGILTINKASIAGLKPEITGDAIAGGTLTAKFEKTDNFNYVWTVGGVDIPTGNENYLDILPEDSNQNVTVKVIATDVTTNYTGESDPSETNVKVETYDVSLDVFEATIDTDDPNGAIKAGTIVSVSVVGFEDDSVLGLTYEWTIDGKVQQATGKEFTVPDGIAGVVVVTATPNGNFIGKITKEIGEIGKITLEGQVELDKVNPVVGDVITATINSVNATPENFDLVWVVDRVPTTVTGTTYTVTKADLGKTITARLVGKESYTGAVDAINTANVEPLAPSNVVITTDVTKNSITVTVTADANGTEIEYLIALDDAEPVSAEIVEGVGTCTFEGLSSKTTYTITVVAKNEAYETEATATATTKAAGGTASPVTGGATGTTTKPTTPPATETPSTGETETPSTGETETPSTGETETPATGETTTPETTIVVPEADVVVESKTETATVPAADLTDAKVVAATVKTESGATVEVTVDVAEKAVDSLTVVADKAETEVTGKAADGIVGDAIEVKVDAKSGDTAVAVEATIAIDVEAQAYAYAVDELGNTVRLESAYDAETGKLLIAGVADGTVVAVSTTAPVDFADTADRWSHKEVVKAADLGIVSGRGAGAYAPAELLTRSETNKLKKNLAEVLKLELTVNADVKIDTDPSHWSYESDLWAAQTGITSGTGTTEDGAVIISGENQVVRQDYVTLLARMVKLAIGDITVEGTGVNFADAADVSDYAADAFNLLSATGILRGSAGENGVYANPKANITREEAAALSNRVYEFVKAIKYAK